MTDWQHMAFWPPKKRANGEEFLFWQPRLANGRIVLGARAIVGTHPPGPRETTAWARIDPPPTDEEVARRRVVEALRLLGNQFFVTHSLPGPANRVLRVKVLSALEGRPVPYAKAGVGAVVDALYRALGVPEEGLTPNARENDFARRARERLEGPQT